MNLIRNRIQPLEKIILIIGLGYFVVIIVKANNYAALFRIYWFFGRAKARATEARVVWLPSVDM